MTFIIRCLFICFLLMTQTLVARADNLSPDETAAVVNAVIKPILQRNKVPGATVVIYNQGVPQAFYFGTATHHEFNHVNAATAFEIGSITKVFTSILLAYAVNQRLVYLQDPVAFYLKQSPVGNRAFNRITVESLATHVAGLGQIPSSTVKNRDQLFQSLKTWHPAYQVNTYWRYSNIGFGLLGYLLEDVYHQSYIKMIDRDIVRPLRMQDTNLVGAFCFNCAQGYSWNGEPVNTTKTLLVIPAAGSIRSSGRDMLKFLGAVLDMPGTPPQLSAAIHLTEMPYFETQYGAQGLGWEIHDFDRLKASGYIQARYNTLTLHAGPVHQVTPARLKGVVLYDKTGSVAGFRAYIVAVPARKTGVVILINAAMPRTQVVLAARQLLYKMLH